MLILIIYVTIFVILVVWFLLTRVARLMIHTPTAINIYECLSMEELIGVFIAMRCTFCGHFLFFVQAEDGIRDYKVTGVQTFFFFQAEDGIRDYKVTGVQTCALPISGHSHRERLPRNG